MVKKRKTIFQPVFSILLILSVFMMVRCSFPENYSGIAWNVDLDFPLMNRVYPIFDLEDGSNIIIENDNMFLVYFEELESDDVSSELKINPKSSETTLITDTEEGTYVSISIDEEDEVDLIYGVVDQGVFKIEVIDPVPGLEELDIVFLNIFDTDGEAFRVIINDFTEDDYAYDITGFSVGEEESTTVIDELDFRVNAVSDGSQFELGYLRIFFDEMITFEYFVGFLDDKRIDLHDDLVSSEVNFPYNISNALRFEEAVFELTFANELGFDAQFVGTFTGYNEKDNKEFSLHITEDDNIVFERAEEIGVPKTSTVALDKPELSDLINTFPNRILIENSYFLLGNKDHTPGFAYSSDKSDGSINLTIPALMTISNETIVPDTVHTLDITEENRKNIEEYMESVFLSFDLENSLPVGAKVDLYFSENPDTLYIFNPDENPDIQTLVFPNSHLSAAISESMPTSVKQHFQLDREGVELFLNERIYFAMKITFDESDGTVTILPHHYVKVFGRVSLNINIDL